MRFAGRVRTAGNRVIGRAYDRGDALVSRAGAGLRQPAQLFRVKIRSGLGRVRRCRGPRFESVAAGVAGRSAMMYAAIDRSSPGTGALDMARPDIAGKSCQAPVYRFLGGPTRHKRPCRIPAPLTVWAHNSGVKGPTVADQTPASSLVILSPRPCGQSPLTTTSVAFGALNRNVTFWSSTISGERKAGPLPPPGARLGEHTLGILRLNKIAAAEQNATAGEDGEGRCIRNDVLMVRWVPQPGRLGQKSLDREELHPGPGPLHSSRN